MTEEKLHELVASLTPEERERTLTLLQELIAKEKPTYAVVFNLRGCAETEVECQAWSLAELCNKLRPMGAERIRVWSPEGVQLIDTKHGDAYSLIAK